jgi:colanic acid biosynthesis glycosyl transferase WcaI
MASGRAVVAAIDAGTEVTRLIDGAQCGVSVPPDDAEALTTALRRMLDNPVELGQMGARARGFVEQVASPASVARHYVTVIEGLPRRP